MNLETLEFVIYPDGRVLEKVTGIAGSSCAEVTAKIEAELGVVVSRETSSEYYAQQLVQAETATQSTFSNW